MPLVSCIRVVPGCQGSGSGGTGEEKARVLLFNYTSLNHSFLCCCKSLFLLPHFGKATDFGDKGCSGEGWGKKQKSNHFFLNRTFMPVFSSDPYSSSVYLIHLNPEPSVLSTSSFPLVFLKLLKFAISFLTFFWPSKYCWNFLSNMFPLFCPFSF